jgi:transposase
MSKRSWRMGNVKSAALSEGDIVVVGLDVHKKTAHVAMRRNGVEAATWVMPMDVETVVKTLLPMKRFLKKVVYEAGPTGYGLARALKQAGLPIAVLAPGKIEREPNPGSKTDRLDCRKLAEHAEEKKSLKVVAIPTEEEEADRQVWRLRDQLMNQQRRVKQQIKSLLLQHGVTEPDGLAHWNATAVEALKRMGLRHQLQLSLAVLIEELEKIVALRERVERHLGWVGQRRRHRHAQSLLRSHPGVGPLTAMAFRLEVYRPERFADAEEVACYVGLAPRIRQSGPKRLEGPLIKAGRGTLRALLIEASWRWVREDARAAALYRRLTRNTGSAQKAIVGVARHMAVNLWCMLCRNESYRAAA